MRGYPKTLIELRDDDRARWSLGPDWPQRHDLGRGVPSVVPLADRAIGTTGRHAKSGARISGSPAAHHPCHEVLIFLEIDRWTLGQALYPSQATRQRTCYIDSPTPELVGQYLDRTIGEATNECKPLGGLRGVRRVVTY